MSYEAEEFSNSVENVVGAIASVISHSLAFSDVTKPLCQLYF